MSKQTKSLVGQLVFGAAILYAGYTAGRIKGMNETNKATIEGKTPPMLRKLNAIGEFFGIIDAPTEHAEFGSFNQFGEFKNFPTPRYTKGDEDDDFDDIEDFLDDIDLKD